ncbi:PfaD family polyunsaturated fatty acid/polyketide biosynthesis protein [Pendulispora albinea]|uniref:PfaD family polyunsaturated fatty acid/polyketide biosynthesis protein n=1 Tax=Pendulispora albinea TaxID=2741071 RepID=A0ABZ2MB42_9BACT
MSKQKTVFMFSGQGSHYYQMGKELFEEHPIFRKTMLELDESFAKLAGGSVLKELYREDRKASDWFDTIRYTHPGIFMVEWALFQALRSEGIEPDCVFGVSAGEFAAAAAAGMMKVEDVARCIAKQVEVIEATCPTGAMLAVLADPTTFERIDAGGEHAEIAGVHYASHFVLSGPTEGIARVARSLDRLGTVHQKLPVSYPFHSRWVDPTRAAYCEFLSSREMRRARIPFVSCLRGDFLDALAPDHLWQMGRGPILFREAVRALETTGDEWVYVDLGPSGTLAGFVKNNAKERSPKAVVSILSPFGPATKGLERVKELAHAGRSRDAPLVRPAREDQRPPKDRLDAALPAITSETLGSRSFREAYGVKYAYACGAMYRGIASEALVVRAGKAGLLGFFGTGGLEIARIDAAIATIRKELTHSEPFGMNLVHNPSLPIVEDETVALFLARGITTIEAAAFMQVTPALARFRVAGLRRNEHGQVDARHRILAKVSRPEVAEAFLRPVPEKILDRLRRAQMVTEEQAQMAREVPMADDLCVEADSGGHTDRGNLVVLLPTMLRLRDRIAREHGWAARVRVGAAGGIGTPETAAAAFMLGADFILTGSINQCTVEAGTSDAAKDMLEGMDIQDTDYAPAGDMFELGASVQVLRKGVFFPARAKKLYELYQQHPSLDAIDPATVAQIEERYFKKSIDAVWRETKAYFTAKDPREVEKAEANPKHKMALVFRWYFGHSQRLAMAGTEGSRVDYQIHCGPALGAFNQWVRGTRLARWRDRHVDDIALTLLEATAGYLNRRTQELAR